MSRLPAVTLQETIVLVRDVFQLEMGQMPPTEDFHMVLEPRVLSLVRNQLTARRWGTDLMAIHHSV
jgi:hypothetical protein